MKKVLIIGIDSFTGKHLSSYLNNNMFEVYGTTFLETKTKTKNIFQCDITDKKNIHAIILNLLPDFIINLAGISFVATSNSVLFYKVNVLAVENILNSILEISNYNPQKVILVSSATVYGNQIDNVLDESMIPNPINHYAISKYAMEQIVKTYYDKLNIIITRPFNYTGIGQEEHFLIPKIVAHYKNRKDNIELGNINVFREFNDVLFVCEVYKRLFESSVKSDIVNIASNRVIALKDVIKMMNQISNYDIKVSINQKFIRKNEITKLSGSSDKLFKFLGKIHQKEFIETLKDMYND